MGRPRGRAPCAVTVAHAVRLVEDRALDALPAPLATGHVTRVVTVRATPNAEPIRRNLDTSKRLSQWSDKGRVPRGRHGLRKVHLSGDPERSEVMSPDLRAAGFMGTRTQARSSRRVGCPGRERAHHRGGQAERRTAVPGAKRLGGLRRPRWARSVDPA